MGLRYSVISQDEIYFLPIFRKENQIYVYNLKTISMTNGIQIEKNEIVEFILPIEKIEIFQILNLNIDNFLMLI